MSSRLSVPLPAVVVLPVKPPSVGKSRLVDVPVPRHELAAAFALDTATAVLATPGVVGLLAVTDDHRFAEQLAAVGCTVVPDPLDGDLNGTLRQGAADACRRWPGSLPVALCADLPALRSADLAEALAVVCRRDVPSYVADADGTGTTLYAAPLAEFDPRFGPGSAAAHADSGALAVPGALSSLRHDVDDAAGLAGALVLGAGPRTAALLRG